ncbi:large ribosomal subunit protein bL28m [Periplaneta americana]|uniref:large ribosomal subunit protein bL28m n=1 Tax=Periplaneta americana TaxID=6978 RepID=UPI0037E9B9B7
MTSTKVYGHVNRLLNFAKPDQFSNGVAARLPEAYKKFWNEWKVRQPAAVHYIPEPGKWKRDPETGVVTPVQNTPIPLVHTKESHKGLWGGEAVIKGFQKRDPQRRRVPHFWFPALHRSVIYSEILNKHMSIIVTQRALDLIHKNYGLDHYILKTPACDLQSLFACKLKRKMMLALLHKDLYPEDPEKREEVYNTYEKYIGEYNAEEIDWYGLDFFEAIKKQMSIEESMYKPMPLKILYRAELVEKLQAAGIQGVKDALEEHEDSLQSRKSSWISKLNPFSSRKEGTT